MVHVEALITNEKMAWVPPMHLANSAARRQKTTCRQTLRNEVPAARNLALSCRHLPVSDPELKSINSADLTTTLYHDNAPTRAVASPDCDKTIARAQRSNCAAKPG